MILTDSTRAAMAESFDVAAQATRENHPGLDAVLHELHAGLSRLMPTRPAEAGELAPVVTALGAPGVPREAIELLKWMSARHEADRRERVMVTFAAGIDGYEVDVDADLRGTTTFGVARAGKTLAEAASRALSQVTK